MAHLLDSIIQKPEKVSYEGRDKDEQILYIVRKSKIIIIWRLMLFVLAFITPFFLVPVVIKFNISNNFILKGEFIVTVTILWYLLCFGYLLMSFINWYFNVFIITNKKIVDIDVNGLLYKNVSEASLRNIEDVTSIVKGTFGVMFNIGEVALQTAGEKREFEFTMVDNPSYIRDLVSDLVANLKRNVQNN